MKTHTVNVTTLKRIVSRLVKAEVADCWKGGGDPDHIPYIEAELKDARAALNNYLKGKTHVQIT